MIETVHAIEVSLPSSGPKERVDMECSPHRILPCEDDVQQAAMTEILEWIRLFEARWRNNDDFQRCGQNVVIQGKRVLIRHSELIPLLKIRNVGEAYE